MLLLSSVASEEDVLVSISCAFADVGQFGLELTWQAPVYFQNFDMAMFCRVSLLDINVAIC